MEAFQTSVTGWFFIAAAAMLWGGWTLLPVKIGTFFQPDDFSRVLGKLRTWIWLYRLHIFGYVLAVMGFVALATLFSGNAARIVIWPGIAVCGAGLIVAALAQAFYYHFGAWGALDMKGKSESAVETFVDSLRVGTEYVTCLVRFARVFFGFGQIVLAAGLFYGEALPLVVGIAAAVLGLAAIGLTMGLPDNLEHYAPVFHGNVAWLVVIGVTVLRL